MSRLRVPTELITRAGPLRVIFSGAGTGGHLFPGIAVAEALRRATNKAEILFITTGRQMETDVLDRYGFAHEKISASGIKGKGPVEKIAAVTRLAAGLLQFLKISKRFSPMVVIGMGGYVSAPAILGARLLRVPCVICEQNSIPGLTNRVLCRFADRIYTAFPDTGFPVSASRIRHAGNPVRQEILACRTDNGTEAAGSKFTVLILGGSQGAHAVNLAVMDALGFLENKERYFFIHQTGARDAEQVGQAYEKFGIAAEVKAFFDDMGAQYIRADLAICRAGATTIAELSAMGLPALFIPLPGAADNHQVFNARYVAESGGAEMIEEKDVSGEILAERIHFYACHGELLATMRRAAARISKSDAAELISSDIIQHLASGGFLHH